MGTGHRTFDEHKPFVARSAFNHEGVTYATGAPFPWRELGLTLRKLWTLWGARLVDNATAPPAAKPIAAPQPAQPKTQGRAARR